MPVRLLYGIASLLLVALIWQAWGYSRIYGLMDYKSGWRSIGPSSETARVTVDAYLDYMSLPSKEASPLIGEVAGMMPGVRVVVHAVISSPVSREAAQIVFAAGLQNKFAAMHEAMLRNEEPLTAARIRDLASQAEIDFERLMKDSRGTMVASMLDADRITRESLNLASIPAFIVDKDIVYMPPARMDVRTDVMQNFVPLLNKAREQP